MFKLRQKVSKKPPSEPIDVESLQLSSKGQQAKADKTWIHTELYCLLQSDRDILLNPAAWLNDNIVSAVQKLLKQQLPVRNGFQDPCCGLTYAFEIMSDEFIQVLHNGHDHWLTISTIGAAKDEVFVFDSMYASVSTKVKHQIAALLATQTKAIKLSFVDVQKQSGGYDCGLFALAFATALVNGINPGRFLYDQRNMRKHLLECLRNKKMELFPVLKTRRAEMKIKCEDFIEVYCKCRMPEIVGVDMVQCGKCSEWFHVHCVHVPSEVMEESNVDWFCYLCV